MQVINGGQRLRVCTFDGDLVIRLQPGQSIEVEGAKHGSVRDVEMEQSELPGHGFGLHEHVRRTVLDDFDSGDGR